MISRTYLEVKKMGCRSVEKEGEEGLSTEDIEEKHRVRREAKERTQTFRNSG
jgi:hypothetical protein